MLREATAQGAFIVNKTFGLRMNWISHPSGLGN
jgi:hypothetical protein